MSRTAIISDIHSNIHALSAVIEDVQAQACTDVVCLGDIVGYNAYPRECLDYIRALNCPTIRGNHDEEVVLGTYALMNPIAKEAMEWTRNQLDDDQLKWLARLPFVRLVRSQFAMVHATLDNPKSWFYIINASDAAASFTRQAMPLCFHGHTHVPRVYAWDGVKSTDAALDLSVLRSTGELSFSPEAGRKYFINVGSVGQSRDGDPRACYSIYDSDSNVISMRRVTYDLAAAQAGILAAGLPTYLADRLATGQ